MVVLARRRSQEESNQANEISHVEECSGMTQQFAEVNNNTFKRDYIGRNSLRIASLKQPVTIRVLPSAIPKGKKK